jgi:hypothetical protein
MHGSKEVINIGWNSWYKLLVWFQFVLRTSATVYSLTKRKIIQSLPLAESEFVPKSSIHCTPHLRPSMAATDKPPPATAPPPESGGLGIPAFEIPKVEMPDLSEWFGCCSDTRGEASELAPVSATTVRGVPSVNRVQAGSPGPQTVPTNVSLPLLAQNPHDTRPESKALSRTAAGQLKASTTIIYDCREVWGRKSLKGLRGLM